MRMKRGHHGQRQQFAERPHDDERQRRAGEQPDSRTYSGENDDLGQVDREDVAAGRAERLEGRDHVAVSIDMAFDGVGDANPADQKRGEAYQSQELGKTADGALKLRGSIAAAANLPTGLRQRASHPLDRSRGGAVVGGIFRKFQSVDPAYKAARLQQSSAAQAGLADQEARAQSEPARKSIRLGVDDAADLKAGVADAHSIADL